MEQRLENERGDSRRRPFHVVHHRPESVRPRSPSRPASHGHARGVDVLRTTPVRGYVLAGAREVGLRRR